MTEEILLPAQKLRKLTSNLELMDVIYIRGVHEIRIYPSNFESEFVEIGNKIEILKTDYDNKNGLLNVFVNMKVEGKVGNDEYAQKVGLPKEDKDPVVLIDVTYATLFRQKSLDVDFKQDEIEIFARTNAVYNVYPYLRQYVQEVSMKFGITPILIPFLRPLSANQINDLFKTPVET